jgi:hypothetical protein
MTGITSEPLLVKNILHTFGEYPGEVVNINDISLSLGVFGDMYTVTTSTI